MCGQVHAEPLLGLAVTEAALVTACQVKPASSASSATCLLLLSPPRALTCPAFRKSKCGGSAAAVRRTVCSPHRLDGWMEASTAEMGWQSRARPAFRYRADSKAADAERVCVGAWGRSGGVRLVTRRCT